MPRAEGAQAAVTYSDGLPGAVVAALGRLDIVVDNAGAITRGPVTKTSDADWGLSVGVNVEPRSVSRAPPDR